MHEAASTLRFKHLLAPYPEFAVPAVVPSLSSGRVLTTEWMGGVPIDRAAKEAMSVLERDRVATTLYVLSACIRPPSIYRSVSERDRVGARLLWLSLTELFSFRFMQTDPNWSHFSLTFSPNWSNLTSP